MGACAWQNEQASLAMDVAKRPGDQRGEGARHRPEVKPLAAKTVASARAALLFVPLAGLAASRFAHALEALFDACFGAYFFRLVKPAPLQ
jgi:hypothetical protein